MKPHAATCILQFQQSHEDRDNDLVVLVPPKEYGLHIHESYKLAGIFYAHWYSMIGSDVCKFQFELMDPVEYPNAPAEILVRFLF